MRELTFEEMDEVAGGIDPVSLILGAVVGWGIGKVLDTITDPEYWRQLAIYAGQYGGSAYDYSALYKAQSN
jgi:hypothetical protein